MPGSFERWRMADESWFDSNSAFLTRVFQWFLEHGKWPDVKILQHSLYQSGDRETNVSAVANAMPSLPGQSTPGDRVSISLSARHLLKVLAAQELLEATVVTTRTAVKAFLLPENLGKQISLKRSDVQANWPIEDKVLGLIPSFINSDHPTPFSGGGSGSGGDWTLNVSEEFVMRFEGVANSKSYVDQQLAIIHEWSDDYDGRCGDAAKIGPVKAFVVMPFDEDWSDSVYSFIKRVVEKFNGDVIALRADDIASPGRITDQIVTELRECDFVIAEITNNNPNVMWEMGFAYAYNKPCVILRSKEASKSPPFDIYDHRWVVYSPDPTDLEEMKLETSIRDVISKIRLR